MEPIVGDKFTPDYPSVFTVISITDEMVIMQSDRGSILMVPKDIEFLAQ